MSWSTDSHMEGWPLVGREEELAFVFRAMERPGVGGVVLAGAPGVGKTRLAREVVRCGCHRDWEAVWGTATRAARSIPFGALAHLLPAPESGPIDRLELLFRARRTLAERAGGRRLLFVVDDAQLLDDGSATLVYQLAVTNAAGLVLTLAGGEAAPDAITGLWKDGRLEYVELQRLNREESDALLRGLVGGEVARSTLAGVWEATRGNPLFVCELVRAGTERGVLRCEGGVWRWRGRFVGDGRLAALIGARVDALAGSEREALEVLAVAEVVAERVFERLVEPGARVGLERHGLLEVRRDRRRAPVALAHPLIGEQLRAAMGSGRLREVCAGLAEGQQACGVRRREDLLRVASWRLEAVAGGDPGLFVAAARRALRSFDVELAERCARAAVAGGAGVAARQTLGAALSAQGSRVGAHQLNWMNGAASRPSIRSKPAGEALPEVLF